MSDLYKWYAQVRDYELDGNGGVNHATYINYLEEARNEYARDILKCDFQAFKDAGYEFVIASLEIKYRLPLLAQDKFYVTIIIDSIDEKRQHYKQAIYMQSDDSLVASAMIHVACVDMKTERACNPDILKNLFIRL